MKTVVMLLLVTTLFTGCAAQQKGDRSGFLQRHTESKRLALAVEMLEKHNTTGAGRVLKGICTSSAVPGVTDEALFRLALLSLKPSEEKPASTEAHQLLKRLRKEYPASPWTIQAAPLIELIGVAEELRHRNGNLKAVNQSLTREIVEQNRNLQQLKHLDQELEQKSR